MSLALILFHQRLSLFHTRLDQNVLWKMFYKKKKKEDINCFCKSAFKLNMGINLQHVSLLTRPTHQFFTVSFGAFIKLLEPFTIVQRDDVLVNIETEKLITNITST